MTEKVVILEPYHCWIDKENNIYHNDSPYLEELKDELQPHIISLQDVVNYFLEGNPDIQIIDTVYGKISEEVPGAVMFRYDIAPYKIYPWNFLDLLK